MTPAPTPSPDRGFSRRLVALAAIVALLFGGYWLLWAPHRESLVVYCAHDSIYADSILRDFERQTGISVAVRYDTEATKSLGLVELLLQEKARPRCDVFWNNELLGTLQLADEGLLLPYRGSGYERIPAAFKDADARWAGFAARLRLWIVNTNRMTPSEEAIQKATSGDLDRMVIAKPLYGTTRTQFTVLWKLWGRDKLLAWEADRRARHLREVDGNSMVKDLVSAGVCDLGWRHIVQQDRLGTACNGLLQLFRRTHLDLYALTRFASGESARKHVGQPAAQRDVIVLDEDSVL